MRSLTQNDKPEKEQQQKNRRCTIPVVGNMQGAMAVHSFMNLDVPISKYVFMGEDFPNARQQHRFWIFMVTDWCYLSEWLLRSRVFYYSKKWTNYAYGNLQNKKVHFQTSWEPLALRTIKKYPSHSSQIVVNKKFETCTTGQNLIVIQAIKGLQVDGDVTLRKEVMWWRI